MTIPISSIGCYRCSSTNGSAPWCEDLLNHKLADILQPSCKNKDGHPLPSCIEIAGISSKFFSTSS